MSGIGGKKKEVKSFDSFPKQIGLFKGKVVLISPDRERLNKLFGKENSEDDKELDYTGEKEGVESVKVTFWLEVEGKQGLYISHTIMLWNEPRKGSREETENKVQLINCVGDTTWVEPDADGKFDEEALFDDFKNFTQVNTWMLPNGKESEKYAPGAKPAPDGVEILGEKKYRVALRGEEALARFMKSWLNVDWRDKDANLLLDTKKLFAGNFKELTSLIDGDLDVPVVALAYVEVDKDDPEKQYQKIFDRMYLPQDFMKHINNNMKMPNKYFEGIFDKFSEEVTGFNKEGKAVEGKGIKGHFYSLEPLREYDPEEDIAASTSTRADVTTTNSKY